MSIKCKIPWSVVVVVHLLLILQIVDNIILAQSTAVNSASPGPSGLPFFPIPIQGVTLPKLATQPFCSKELAYPNCPAVATFDFIDLRFFVGTWYEIGTTGQNKLSTEAGSICQQINYTLANASEVGTTTELKVLTTALQVTGPVATFGIQSVGGATRRVCNAAKRICSSLSPTSQIIQTSAQVGSLGVSLSITHPSESATLLNVTNKISATTKQLQSVVDLLAKNISVVQQLVSVISNNDGLRDASIDQLKLALASTRDLLANGTLLVSEVDHIRSDILEVATSLLGPKTLVPDVPPFDTIGQLWTSAVELNDQENLLQTKLAKIQINLANIEASFGLLKVDKSNQSRVVTEVGSIVQNSTSSGKLQLHLPNKLSISKNSPLWILALDGVPSEGYQAALTYSCTENANSNVKKALSIISRSTTLSQSIIQKYLLAAITFGFDFECDDPFVFSKQDPTCTSIFDQQST